MEAEQLRDEIAAGYNKLYEASIVSTLFAYSKDSFSTFIKDSFVGSRNITLCGGHDSISLLGIPSKMGIE